MDTQTECCGKTGAECTCDVNCGCRSTQCIPTPSSQPKSESPEVSIGETAKVLFDRTFRTVKKATGKVVETAGGVAVSTVNLAQTAAGEAKKVAGNVVNNVSDWSPLAKVAQVPAGIKEAVVEAKKLSSLEDLRQEADSINKNISSLVKERESIFLQLYQRCDHKKLWRVPGQEKLLGSTPPVKICMICGLAEEGKVGEWTSGFFKFTAEAKPLDRVEMDSKILRKFSREELERINSK